MHLLIVSTDENFSGLLGTMLSSSGPKSSSANSMGVALSTLSRTEFDLILIDLPPALNESIDLMSALRQGSNANKPVVFCSEFHHKTSKELQKVMQRFSVDLFMKRPFDMFEAPKVLIEASKHKVKPNHAENRKVARGALRALSKIWRERSTGVLRVDGRDDWAVIGGGGPTEPNGLLLLSEALSTNGFSFAPADLGGTGDLKGFGHLLWNGALSLIGEHHHLRLTTSGLTPTQDLFSSSLPFSNETLRLLTCSNGKRRFEELCQEMGLDKGAVGIEIGALALLSLVELSDLGPEELTVTRPRRRQPARPPTSNILGGKARAKPPVYATLKESHESKISKILALLLEDLERLKGKDSFTILGISPKCTQAVAEEAGARNIKRYQEILRGDISTEVRVAAQKMLTMVTTAAATVASARQGVSDEPVALDMSNMTTEERAFTQGKKAFHNRDYTLARRSFKRARDERLDSVDNLAWLGWAVYHDTDIEKEERVKEAFDMLRLANSFNPHHEEGQYFLAYVEGHHGLMAQALQRLRGLLGNNPNHESAKNLAREYRRMLNK